MGDLVFRIYKIQHHILYEMSEKQRLLFGTDPVRSTVFTPVCSRSMFTLSASFLNVSGHKTHLFALLL